MSDEKAKAVQEVAKATGKAIDAADKAGNFFSRVFGQPIEDTVGTFWGDPIRTRRIERGIDLSVRVQKKLQEAGTSDIQSIADKVGVPLIESATLEDEPTLKEMWVNLLVAAVSGYEVEKNFVKTLDLFTPSNARLLNYLYPLRYAKNHELRKFSAGDACSEAGVEEHDVRSLIRFGIVDSTYSEITYGTGHNRSGTFDLTAPISNGLEEFEFTDFGLNFSECIIVESER